MALHDERNKPPLTHGCPGPESDLLLNALLAARNRTKQVGMSSDTVQTGTLFPKGSSVAATTPKFLLVDSHVLHNIPYMLPVH